MQVILSAVGDVIEWAAPCRLRVWVEAAVRNMV